MSIRSFSSVQVTVETAGEAFPDKVFIELVSSADRRDVRLLRWQDGNQIVGNLVEHDGLQYRPRSMHHSLLRSLQLPDRVGSFGTDRELHSEICACVDKFANLPPKVSSLIGRFVLATWVVEALEIAPTLLIEGPDLERANQLVHLLHCLCRRALSMSAVGPTSICTLPGGMCFTLLIRQPAISAKLSNVLHCMTRPDTPILRGGELHHLFGAQVILCDDESNGGSWAGALLRVPCVPNRDKLPPLDHKTQQRIAQEFQPKLLAYRFARYPEASVSRFDSSEFAIALRGLANTLAATTPGDTELQAELHVLLEDENTEIKSASWVNPNTVIIESLLVFCREAKDPAKEPHVYVGEIADMSQVILKGRGETRTIDPGEVGRRLKALGFAVEPRDASGVKLQLSNKVREKVQNLANQFAVPGARDPVCLGV